MQFYLTMKHLALKSGWLRGTERYRDNIGSYFLILDIGNTSSLSPAVGIDAIVTTVLAADYSMVAEVSLTKQIVQGVTAFRSDIESFLSDVDVR